MFEFDYLNEFLFFNKNRAKRGSYVEAKRLDAMGGKYYFNLLCARWCSRYKWEYTADFQTIATELIEKSILMRGSCAIARRPELPAPADSLPFNFLPSSINKKGFYGYPTNVMLQDFAGQTYGQRLVVLDSDYGFTGDCVLITDNAMGHRPIETILFYADRLQKINNQVNVCIANIKGTVYLTAPDELQKDIAKAHLDSINGQPVIIGKEFGDNVRMDFFESSPAVDSLKALYEAFDKTLADFDLDIGIRSNGQMNKQSGVTPLEITENRQGVTLKLNQGLDQRKKSIKQLERIGITGLSVDLGNFENKTSELDQTKQGGNENEATGNLGNENTEPTD